MLVQYMWHFTCRHICTCMYVDEHCPLLPSQDIRTLYCGTICIHIHTPTCVLYSLHCVCTIGTVSSLPHEYLYDSPPSPYSLIPSHLLPIPHSCEVCNCSSAGSVNLTCDDATGRCMCKEFVEGDLCDTCIAGFDFLEAVNPSGCSAGGYIAPSRTFVTNH